jgi:CheY-like chemotaxis protein
MLLDIHMPMVMGMEVIKRLRKYIRIANTTREIQVMEPMFVIVSAYVNPSLRL